MSFFKAYDMRGTFGVDFDLETVYRVGRALPQVVPGKRWLVGRDGRDTSEAVRTALVRGLVEAGVTVDDLGLCTTSMVYFFTVEDDYDGSVMITASHNPAGDNGLKVSRRGGLPVGYADGLDVVERLVRDEGDGGAEFRRRGRRRDEGGRLAAESPLDGFREATPRLGDALAADAAVAAVPDALRRYLAWQREHALPMTGLRLAVDCSNGMSSLWARELFPDAVFLNDTPDGTFPGHSPNPLLPESRAALSDVVRTQHLDAGIIFDGDADRAMFVDETGVFVQPDYLIPVVARATRCACEGEGRGVREPWKVIHDVRTSRGAIETLREEGFEPVMVPVGHAFAKPILRRIGALCGGELAGHYYFREFFGCDSGLLAATRVLSEVAKARSRGQTFSGMMAPIVTRYANSGELNFRVEDKDAAIARVLARTARDFPMETGRSTLDGVRLEYDDGWINIRKSNTEPYLRLLVEARTAALLESWQAMLAEEIAG